MRDKQDVCHGAGQRRLCELCGQWRQLRGHGRGHAFHTFWEGQDESLDIRSVCAGHNQVVGNRRKV